MPVEDFIKEGVIPCRILCGEEIDNNAEDLETIIAIQRGFYNKRGLQNQVETGRASQLQRRMRSSDQ